MEHFTAFHITFSGFPLYACSSISATQWVEYPYEIKCSTESYNSFREKYT